MSHFYGSVQGNRGVATRCGSERSGIQAHIRGWNVGASVLCTVENGADVVRVYRTQGSNGPWNQMLIAEFKQGDAIKHPKLDPTPDHIKDAVKILKGEK